MHPSLQDAMTVISNQNEIETQFVVPYNFDVPVYVGSSDRLTISLVNHHAITLI